jgi:hypothetical protein
MVRVKRLALAIGIAVLLHAALFLLLPRRSIEPRRAGKPITVEVREVPKPAPPPPAVAPVQATGPGRHASRRAAPKSSGAPAIATNETQGTIPIPQGAPKPLNLTLPQGEFFATGSPAAPAEPEGNGLVKELSPDEKLAQEKAVVQGRVRGWINDTAARQRAETKDVYWQGIEDKLASNFKPQWDVLDKGQLPGSRSGVFGEALSQWQRAAQEYGKTGAVDISDSSAFSHRLIAHLSVRQAEDGSIVEVKIETGSGNRFYDSLALDDVRALGAALGPPPKDHLLTLWAFETDFIQIPPLPIFGCSFDDFIPKDCAYPLKKSVKSRLRLEAVY